MKITRKIAILASDNMMPDSKAPRGDIFEREEQMAKLRPAFADLGMELDLVRWRQAPDLADKYDAMLPLLVWDYAEGNREAFLRAMAEICQKTNLFNRFDILKWNSNKSYLQDLTNQGAPTIPCLHVDKVTEKNIKRAFDEFDTDKLVVKPDIGAGAWRQAIVKKSEPIPTPEQLPPAGALIQPFMKSVQEIGEYSFLYFGGGFSHALLKQAKKGDYRIQSIYGGTETPYIPTKAERAQARAVLDVLDFTPLYARVDLVPDNNGNLLLIELEMIEPYLYLPMAKGDGADNKGAKNLAKALLKKLNS